MFCSNLIMNIIKIRAQKDSMYLPSLTRVHIYVTQFYQRNRGVSESDSQNSVVFISVKCDTNLIFISLYAKCLTILVKETKHKAHKQ